MIVLHHEKIYILYIWFSFQLSEALTLLTDPEARKAYDNVLKARQATQIRHQLLVRIGLFLKRRFLLFQIDIKTDKAKGERLKEVLLTF